MSSLILVRDTTTNKTKAYATLFTDYKFTVGGGGQSVFSPGVTVPASPVKIDSWVGGVLKEEGATLDFQRNTGANTIDYNETLPQDTRVIVRIYSF